MTVCLFSIEINLFYHLLKELELVKRAIDAQKKTI